MNSIRKAAALVATLVISLASLPAVTMAPAWAEPAPTPSATTPAPAATEGAAAAAPATTAAPPTPAPPTTSATTESPAPSEVTSGNPVIPHFFETPPPTGAKGASRPKVSTEAYSLDRSGVINVRVVNVQLADRKAAISDTDATSAMGTAKAYWEAMSNGRLSMNVGAPETWTSKATSTQRYPDMMNTIAGELNWPVNPNPWTALVVFVSTPTLSDGAYGAGWSYNGTSGRVIMPLPGSSSLTHSVLTHEFGHVLGLMHANSLQCTDGAVDVATNADGSFANGSCSVQEYKDTLDLMGASQASRPVISSPMWEYGGFGNGHEIFNAGTVSGKNSYTLKAWGGADDSRAVKFTDPVSGETYYLELRLPVGNDAATAVNGNRGVKIVQAFGAGSIALPPSTVKYYSTYYSGNQAWQAGQTFTTHAGTRVSIDSISDSAAVVTITAIRAPRGSFDDFSVHQNRTQASLQVSGWAVDMADTSVAIQAHVYITGPDGTTAGYPVLANGSRPDVDQVFGVGAYHGFQQVFGFSVPGPYQVCVYAIGQLAKPLLGCKSQNVVGVPSPYGFLEPPTLNKTATTASITARGWTVDPGTPAASIPAHIYITSPDGTTQGYPFTADQARADVNQATGASGNHGYSATVPVTKPGTYKICSYGIAVTPLSYGNSLLGCQALQAPASPSPYGFLEPPTLNKTATTASITARGWTVDPGTPAASIPAHIYITSPDGTTQGYPFTADQARADVNQATGASGNHGYSATVPVTKPGTYKICSYGIAVTPLSYGNSLLGCQTVQAPAVPSPTGFLEPPTLSQTLSGPVLNARGWVVDPGTPATSIPAHIYITSPDGTTQGYPFTADGPRPDVNQFLGVTGNHGYNAVLPIKQPGAYMVCAYGIAVAPFSKGNSLIGCQTIKAQTSPATVGYLDSVSVTPTNTGATLTATGWTADPGTASASIPVHTYVTGPDGVRRGYAFVADISRPDVTQKLGIPGAHGYRTSIDVSQRGTYRVCTYGVAITPLSLGNTELGCQSLAY